MRKIVWLLMVALLLSGCGAVQTFENVEDVYSPVDSPRPADTSYLIPKDADAQVLTGDSGKLYLCNGYDIIVETLVAGDLEKTLKAITGYAEDKLTMLQTGTAQLQRYECAWSAAGEAGDQVGRTVILDDGNYHYCITLTADAQEAGSLQETWQEILNSFCLQS